MGTLCAHLLQFYIDPLKLHRCFGHGLKICLWFGYNPQIIFYHFFCKMNSVIFQAFLAHLSHRLIGELIVYSWSGVRPSVSVIVNNVKHLLQNCLPDQSQILCGASLGRGNESLFAASGSHDQDGRHAHIW